MNYKALIGAALAAITVAVVQASTLDESIPQPWFKNGQDPAAKLCQAGIDTDLEKNGTPNISLRCDTKEVGFVGVMQMFRAGDYVGKRLRFSALVKAEGIEEWGGLWMRVDSKGRSVAFDNMQSRPIKGTVDWNEYSVVLDAPTQSDGVFFGSLLNGKGQLWISNVRFEVVGPEVAVTGSASGSMQDKPGNLSLSR